MKEYKQPETRIKVVRQGVSISYFPQYKVVAIPMILWEWYSTRNQFVEDPWTTNLEDAKESIDEFLIRSKKNWEQGQISKQRKKEKKVIEYIKYP